MWILVQVRFLVGRWSLSVPRHKQQFELDTWVETTLTVNQEGNITPGSSQMEPGPHNPSQQS